MTKTDTKLELNEQLEEMNQSLKEIRDHLSEISSSLRDELEAFREREFWRDYRETYHEE